MISGPVSLPNLQPKFFDFRPGFISVLREVLLVLTLRPSGLDLLISCAYLWDNLSLTLIDDHLLLRLIFRVCRIYLVCRLEVIAFDVIVFLLTNLGSLGFFAPRFLCKSFQRCCRFAW